MSRPETDPGDEAFRRIQQTLFDDWTPSNSQPHEENVEVYSNCAEVELSLNGKSLGMKTLPVDASPRTWRVAWELGTIAATCGNNAARHELHTAGAAAKIVLTSDRPRIGTGWDDVSYVTAQVVDDHGVMVPSASQKITFALTGPGAIVAADNADNMSHEPFQGTTRSAWEGQCLAVIRATAGGRMGVTASAEGLTGAKIEIDAR